MRTACQLNNIDFFSQMCIYIINEIVYSHPICIGIRYVKNVQFRILLRCDII